MGTIEVNEIQHCEQRIIRAALARLGIDRLVLAIHQASFPASHDDLGHGAPASARGVDFLRFAAQQGFDGILFGPGGITSPVNPSPYDATLLSRSPLALSCAPLGENRWGHAVPQAELAALVRPASDRVNPAHAHASVRQLLGRLRVAARQHSIPDLHERLACLERANSWLAAEARFEGIASALGHDDWRRWPPLPPVDDEAAECFRLGQLLAAEQHAELRETARRLGLRLYADAQVGISHRDRFLWQGIFLPDHAMGAPPSRTNPAGQPWGYPVLDPRQLGPGGGARRFVEERLDALLAHHDGLRIDHPHGWVCPWVYDDPSEDPGAAVRAGARLHESPDLPDHPGLAGFARVRPEQLDRSLPRHHDHWVRGLEPAQVDAYALMFDVIVERAAAHGMGPADLLVEVLSTCPRPLAEVLARHGLGRFRVTQKTIVDDPLDVYRGDRAAPADWIMVGNHDTPPLRHVVERWAGSGEGARRAAYLGERLRTRVAADDPADLALAMLAELFLGPARHVALFWVDLFGLAEIYNRPGEISADNWSMRVPPDFEAAFARGRAAGVVPSLPRALALALRARGLAEDDEGRALVARLDDGPARPAW